MLAHGGASGRFSSQMNMGATVSPDKKPVKQSRRPTRGRAADPAIRRPGTVRRRRAARAGGARSSSARDGRQAADAAAFSSRQISSNQACAGPRPGRPASPDRGARARRGRWRSSDCSSPKLRADVGQIGAGDPRACACAGDGSTSAERNDRRRAARSAGSCPALDEVLERAAQDRDEP